MGLDATNSKKPAIPSETASKKMMEPDVPSALKLLAEKKAEDLIDVLGLRPYAS